MILGENGIFGKAKTAKEETLKKEAREAVELVLLSARTEYTVSPEGMNLKNYVEKENNKIEVENTGDETVLGSWTFTYKDEYEFGIYDLKIDSEGPTSKKIKVTPDKSGYAFINSTGKKVTITLNIERKDNSLNGKPITVNVTPNNVTGTLTGDTYILELTTDGSTNYNGKYTFEVTIGTEIASKTVNVDRFLEPELQITDINYNSFKININKCPIEAGGRYKYTVTKKIDSSKIYESDNFETLNSITISNGVEAGTEYKVEAQIYLSDETSNKCETEFTTAIPQDAMNYPIITENGIFNKNQGNVLSFDNSYKLWANDALQTQAFDNDQNTIFYRNTGEENEKVVYLLVDSSARGKKLKVYGASRSQDWAYVLVYISNQNGELGQQVLRGCYDWNGTFTIPTDCEKIGVFMQINGGIREMQLVD